MKRSAIDKSGLSTREAAIIEAARRELTAREAAAPASAGHSSPAAMPATLPPRRASAVVGAGQSDPAARVAALIQAEQERNFRRKKRARQMALAIPILFMVAATLWVAATIFRSGEIW